MGRQEKGVGYRCNKSVRNAEPHKIKSSGDLLWICRVSAAFYFEPSRWKKPFFLFQWLIPTVSGANLGNKKNHIFQ